MTTMPTISAGQPAFRETITWNSDRVTVASASAPSPADPPGRGFYYKKDQSGRMAGSVPVWGTPRTPEEKIARDLSDAKRQHDTRQTGTQKTPDFATALKEAGAETTTSPEFGFGDLVDMVNPLQHIPLVNSVYRSVTGDEIKPISRIIGGAVFGGPLGAASGVANVVVEAETGKDITGNIVSMATDRKAPVFKSSSSDEAAFARVMAQTLGDEGASLAPAQQVAARLPKSPHYNG